MTGLEVQLQAEDSDSLARVLKVKVDGGTLSTPLRALSATRSDPGELEVLSADEFRSTNSFAEVCAALTVDRIDTYLEEDAQRARFEGELDRQLLRARERGQVPYLVIAVRDNNGDPLNRVPAERQLDYLFHLLWRPTNALVVTPVLGSLRSLKEYDPLFSKLKTFRTTLNHKPVVAIIPPVFRELTRTTIERFWESGVRAYGLDLQGRALGAQGTVISLVNTVIRALSRKDEEPHLLLAVNVRSSVGTGDQARLHNLLGHAYGFDVVGQNHLRRKGWAPGPPTRREVLQSIRFLQADDYAYLNVSDLLQAPKKGRKVELDTPATDSTSADQLRRLDVEYLRKIAKLHNTAKDLREESRLQSSVTKGELAHYLGGKARIRRDLPMLVRVTNRAKRDTTL